MSLLTSILCVACVLLLAVAVYYFYCYRTIASNQAVARSTTDDSDNKYVGMLPKELCMQLLKDMNCKVEIDEENADHLVFDFQGETFSMYVSNESLLINIYDYAWGNISLDDISEVSNLRKAINNVNINSGVTVLYSIDDEHRLMVVHSKRQLVMTYQIPSLKDYLTAMLVSFFETQRALKLELDNMRKNTEQHA